jgi:hypothetical protein
MIKIIMIALVLLLVSTTFAGERVFSNSDLETFSDEPMIYKEQTEIYEDQQENIDIDKKDEAINELENRIKRLEDRLEEPPRNRTGDSCDVIDFSSYKSRYFVHEPYSQFDTIIIKHNVTVRIKSKADVEKWVERFYIVAFFDDGDEQTSQLHENPNSIAKWVDPYSEYTGNTTFDGEADIVSLGCFVKEGL